MKTLRFTSAAALTLLGLTGCSGSERSEHAGASTAEDLSASSIAPDTASTTLAFGPWVKVPGSTDVAISATTYVDSIYLFTKGLDGGIYATTYTSGAWSAATPLGGQADAPLASATCFDGVYVVQKGLDQNVYINSRSYTSGWTGWQEVPGGGQTNAGLGLACPAAGHTGLRIYMKGLDGKVYENVRPLSVDSVWQPWTGWGEVGDGWVTNVPIAAVGSDSGNVVLLFDGTNDYSYWKTFTSAAGQDTIAGTWSGWSLIGGTTDVALAGTSAPGVAALAFAKGINDDSGYYAFFLGSSWSGWTSLGVGTTNASYTGAFYAPSTTTANFNYDGYYVFAKGIDDDGIYMKTTAKSTTSGGGSGGGSGGSSGGSSGGAANPFMLLEYCLDADPNILGPNPFSVSVTFTGTLAGTSTTFTQAVTKTVTPTISNLTQCVTTDVYGQKAGSWSIKAAVVGPAAKSAGPCTGSNPGTTVLDISSGTTQCRNTPF